MHVQSHLWCTSKNLKCMLRMCGKQFWKSLRTFASSIIIKNSFKTFPSNRRIFFTKHCSSFTFYLSQGALKSSAMTLQHPFIPLTHGCCNKILFNLNLTFPLVCKIYMRIQELCRVREQSCKRVNEEDEESRTNCSRLGQDW